MGCWDMEDCEIGGFREEWWRHGGRELVGAGRRDGFAFSCSLMQRKNLKCAVDH